MRQVLLERDINIAVNGCSGLATSIQKGPFAAMLISRSRGTYLIRISFHRLHYLAVADRNQHSTSVESTATTATLKGLRPNAQYVIFVQTVDGAGAASEPSETVVAWTDPIVPAYAEPPAIQPR